MSVLIAGLTLFLGVHSVSIVNAPWRDRVAARIGEGPWRALYSLASIAGFVLIVWGYRLAREDPVILYLPPFWLRQVTLLLMVFVFPLLLSAYFPGRIRDTLKHPMLVAIKLWAFAHLLTNGALADAMLFGSLLAWAVADRISMKHRSERAIPRAPRSDWNDAIAVGAGLGVYAAFVLGAHRWLIGVPASAWG